MKTTKNFLIVIITTVMVVLTGFGSAGGATKKVNALSADYPKTNTPMTNIYYFSDSSPAFGEIFDSYIGLNVTYDIQYLLTPQELTYMLYSGYFWGFNQNNINIVIIEIKTIKPDPVVLENLFECLKLQGCKVMFISPYQPEFGDLSFADASMPCDMDKYSRFLKNTIKTMLSANGILENTTILIDGRFIGIDGVPESYNIAELCAASSTLRRLLLYMFYNCNTAAEKDFEKDMYEGIWDLSQDILGSDNRSDHNYFHDSTKISDYIDFWKDLYTKGYEYINNFQLDTNSTFSSGRKNKIGLYYNDIVNELLNVRNINILAHVGGTLYVDILGDLTNNLSANLYNFSTCSDVFDEFDPNGRSVYSMGISRLKNEFYTLLYSIQEDTPNNDQHSGVRRFTYLWIVDPITIGSDGLNVVEEDQLQEINSENCQEDADCTEYDEEILNEMFLDYLDFLLG